MRRCFHCGTRAEGTRLTKVGDGEFCEPCFRSLLEEDSKKEAHEPPRPSSNHQKLPTEHRLRYGATIGQFQCLVCNRELSQPIAVAFLGGWICPECNFEMIDELRRAPSSHPLNTGTALMPAREGTSSSELVLGGESASMSFTPGVETEWCAGCERPMPGPGSYRILEGKPYCPSCVPFYSERMRTKRSHTENEVAIQNGRASVEVGGCDCCGRPLLLKPEPRDGFFLCDACRVSDVELALSVAKLRHRHRLAELGSNLDSEKDK